MTPSPTPCVSPLWLLQREKHENVAAGFGVSLRQGEAAIRTESFSVGVFESKASVVALPRNQSRKENNMGSDATALLAYGSILPTGNFTPEYSGLEDEWDKLHGPQEPSNNDYRSPEWDVYRASMKEYENSPACIRVELYCCDETSRYCVVSKCLVVSVDWQETAEITPELLLRATQEHRRFVVEFCEKFKLPWSEPKWWLMARYF